MLSAIGEAPDLNGRRMVLCRCQCGEELIVRRDRFIREGKPRSCGCVFNSAGMRNTSTYRSWKNMRSRCNNPAHTDYKYWGGKGVKVCERWDSFVNFLEDMGERPEGKTLDRWPNNNGNYEPGNCRWATPKEQLANRRPRG